MSDTSHLRLVFSATNQATVDALLTMKNPSTGELLFKESKVNPDGTAEVLSGPMPVDIAAATPKIIADGQFPHLQDYTVSSFDGESTVYGQAAGMRVDLDQA